MDQTALALVNIDQAKSLHALYRADIDELEVERRRLAAELHGRVLTEMAVLSMKAGERRDGENWRLPASLLPFAAENELHVYRIIQQTCQNAAWRVCTSEQL